VGLSTGITPLLTDPAKLWLVGTMFVGRLGPLVLAAFALRAHKANIHHATGKILLG
jgi:trk system potassium uptake protein TrkH